MKVLLIYILTIACVPGMSQKTRKFSLGDQHYFLDVSKGFICYKIIDDEHYIEYRLAYNDSSIIYITNDDKSGGAINIFKEKKYGKDVSLKILLNETLDLNGEYMGRYWREKKESNVVVGYINVLPQDIEKFNIILSTLRMTRRVRR
ncbi:hypothetical protein [Alkalitalea saponilacus]|nr:hypothetical protein [Alkalitalea saponilacus]